MLRAIILIALVGHAAAVNCVADDTDGDAKVSAVCVDIDGVTPTECWTRVPATGTTTRGCGGAVQCDDSAECVICNTDDCNKKENILKCWVGTVTDGVLDGATKVCAPKDANCYSRSLTATPTTMDKGCGVCADATNAADYTCAGDADCTVSNDYGCNIPKISCFTSTGPLTRYTTEPCDDTDMLTCFTKTKDDDKTVEFGCGKCTSATGYTCGDDCGTIVAAGCNEPPRFQCLQKDNWNVTDTTTKATDCVTGDGAAKDSSLYTQTSCSKIVKDDGTINKACGACSSPAVDGQTCYQCDETGCNSASGLFSVLALSMAVIYQLA